MKVVLDTNVLLAAFATRGLCEALLERAEEALSERARLKRKGWNLRRLIKRVCQLTGVRSAELCKRSRANALSHAKGLIAYWGYQELGIAGIDQPLAVLRFQIADPGCVYALVRLDPTPGVIAGNPPLPPSVV